MNNNEHDEHYGMVMVADEDGVETWVGEHTLDTVDRADVDVSIWALWMQKTSQLGALLEDDIRRSVEIRPSLIRRIMRRRILAYYTWVNDTGLDLGIFPSLLDKALREVNSDGSMLEVLNTVTTMVSFTSFSVAVSSKEQD